MSTQGHVVGLVFCQKIIELAKEVFDIEKIAEDLSLMVCECINQRLEAQLILFEKKLRAIMDDLIIDLSQRSSL